jgi:hypothetical protein
MVQGTRAVLTSITVIIVGVKSSPGIIESILLLVWGYITCTDLPWKWYFPTEQPTLYLYL